MARTSLDFARTGHFDPYLGFTYIQDIAESDLDHDRLDDYDRDWLAEISLNLRDRTRESAEPDDDF